MGKAYWGLCECAEYVTPYLVAAKIGKPSERSRSGNRSKRDAQMVVRHFSMLEIYHLIKNVIGVNPNFFEYPLTVNADAMAEPYTINRLISADRVAGTVMVRIDTEKNSMGYSSGPIHVHRGNCHLRSVYAS